MTLCFVRRFTVGGKTRELRRLMEAPGIPTLGSLVDFADGTPPVSVSHTLMNLRPTEFVPGFYPHPVTVFLTVEPAGDRLAKAEAAAGKAAE